MLSCKNQLEASEDEPEMKVRVCDRVEMLGELCRGKRVLHLGCADAPDTAERLKDGSLLFALLDAVAAEQYGLDISAVGVELLQKSGFIRVATADVENLPAGHPFADQEFDIVLAGEVIEHLPNPGRFLEGLKPLLANGSTRLVLTTPNAFCAHRFVNRLLTGREAVHADHVAYYSPSTIRRLLEHYGYEVQELFYYSAREYEKQLNRGRARILWWLDLLACRFHPMLSEGLVAICQVTPPSAARDAP